MTRKSIAEHFEQRFERGKLMDRIKRTNPRLSQAIVVCQVKDQQLALAERLRKRK